jgi:hypothetical protein
MAANTLPIYTRRGDVQWSSNMTAVNTTTDLTSGTIYLTFSADTTEGGYVQRIRFKPNNAVGVNNVATVARVWMNNGSTTATAANNTFIDEISLPATTGVAAAALPVYELPLNFAMPPGYTLYVTLGTGVAGGYRATVIGGKY